jgi:hypothetical protein
VKLVQALEGRDVARAALLEKPSLLVPQLPRAFGFGQKSLLLKTGDERTILRWLATLHLFSTSSPT